MDSQEFLNFLKELKEEKSQITSLWDIVRLVEKARYKGIKIPSDLEELMILVMKRRWIMHRSLPKIEEVVKLAKEYYEAKKKVIIFAMDIKSCENFARRLESLGVPSSDIFVVHSSVLSQYKETNWCKNAR